MILYIYIPLELLISLNGIPLKRIEVLASFKVLETLMNL